MSSRLLLLFTALAGCDAPFVTVDGGDSPPDLAGADLKGADLAGVDFAWAPGADLAMRPGADLAMQPGADLAMRPGADMAMRPGADMAVVNQTGVGPHGGTVSLLHFGITGDTRPPSCEDTAGYPTSVINGIVDQMSARNIQFGLDLGDHMYVCNNDLTTATTQMNLYMQSIGRFNGTFFMTEGNHECYGGLCLQGSTNANYVAFMTALAPIATSPYYTFNIDTSLGRATFVIIADNSWDQNQAAWLTQTLTTADQAAKYTIVARHHPEGDSSVTTNSDSMAIVRQHKFALFLTGHSHLYDHMTTDNGRDLVLGTGGAPLIAGGAFHGYGIIDQTNAGMLQVTIYDTSTNAQVDSWSVGPNQ
jgi:hypothetical protein